MSKADLKLDWCSHEAAKYAVERWHYSRTMPVAKQVRIGAWEGKEFVGAVLFSWGANPNLAKAYGLAITECAELVRVTLRKHRAPVSRILAIAVKMLRRQSPGLRLLVSYADTREGHHGGIYQAAGWLYAGETSEKFDYVLDGQILQRRAFTGSNFGAGKMTLPPGAEKVRSPKKYRYLMPLDREMRAQILPLAKPYPKRAGSADSGTAEYQSAGGGANPTPALTIDNA